MDPKIIIEDLGREYFTEELCHITELLNTEDDAALSIARARVEPGVTTRWHHLKQSTERYVILSGCGEVEVGELANRTVRAGDVVLIPPCCRQRIRNTGDEDLIFLALCTPRFVPEDYVDLETPA